MKGYVAVEALEIPTYGVTKLKKNRLQNLKAFDECSV